MAASEIHTPAKMLVKVCGMASPQSISAVAALRPNFMGFIFHEPSPRNALALSPAVVKALPQEVCPVGVFVNKDYDAILATCARYGLRAVQLHGSETPALCERLRREGLTVIKAFGVEGELPLEHLRAYEDAANLLVLDAKTPAHGGSGRKYDWSVLSAYDLRTPFLLSGGIGPGDARTVRSLRLPRLAGVDLNSRFETAPGVKDAPLLSRFIQELFTN